MVEENQGKGDYEVGIQRLCRYWDAYTSMDVGNGFVKIITGANLEINPLPRYSICIEV